MEVIKELRDKVTIYEAMQKDYDKISNEKDELLR